MMRALVLVAIAGCSSTARSASEPDGKWHCFVAAPGTPDLPQGNVTHAKRRVAADRIDIVNRHVRGGMPGVTRLSVPRAGDHFEGPMGQAKVTIHVLTPDGLHTFLKYEDPALKWSFTDDIVIDAKGMRITSTDESATGPVETTLDYVRADCAAVDDAVAATELGAPPVRP